MDVHSRHGVTLRLAFLFILLLFFSVDTLLASPGAGDPHNCAGNPSVAPPSRPDGSDTEEQRAERNKPGVIEIIAMKRSENVEDELEPVEGAEVTACYPGGFCVRRYTDEEGVMTGPTFVNDPALPDAVWTELDEPQMDGMMKLPTSFSTYNASDDTLEKKKFCDPYEEVHIKTVPPVDADLDVDYFSTMAGRGVKANVILEKPLTWYFSVNEEKETFYRDEAHAPCGKPLRVDVPTGVKFCKEDSPNDLMEGDTVKISLIATDARMATDQTDVGVGLDTLFSFNMTIKDDINGDDLIVCEDSEESLSALAGVNELIPDDPALFIMNDDGVWEFDQSVEVDDRTTSVPVGRSGQFNFDQWKNGTTGCMAIQSVVIPEDAADYNACLAQFVDGAFSITVTNEENNSSATRPFTLATTTDAFGDAVPTTNPATFLNIRTGSSADFTEVLNKIDCEGVEFQLYKTDDKGSTPIPIEGPIAEGIILEKSSTGAPQNPNDFFYNISEEFSEPTDHCTGITIAKKEWNGFDPGNPPQDPLCEDDLDPEPEPTQIPGPGGGCGGGVDHSLPGSPFAVLEELVQETLALNPKKRRGLKKEVRGLIKGYKALLKEDLIKESPGLRKKLKGAKNRLKKANKSGETRFIKRAKKKARKARKQARKIVEQDSLQNRCAS